MVLTSLTHGVVFRKEPVMRREIRRLLFVLAVLGLIVPSAPCFAATSWFISFFTPTPTVEDTGWANLMDRPIRGDLRMRPVGQGFGDQWNKYSWTMNDFKGGLIVATKNANYDAQQIFDPSPGVEWCIDDEEFYQVTGIHKPLACMELFASTATGLNAANSRGGEIWRFDYASRLWGKVYDDHVAQGFRDTVEHNGKLYVASDLGAFITGVDLLSGGPMNWNFPGSRLLSSADGKRFTEVTSCTTAGPCNSTTGAENPYGIIIPPYPIYQQTQDGPTDQFMPEAVNISIRALASYQGKLYVGTFNTMGGQLWAYTVETDTWEAIFVPGMNTGPNPYKPAAMELAVFQDKLYIGFGGPAGETYLYSYDGTGLPALVDGQPLLAPSNMGVIKLFPSTSQDLLFIGNVDFDLGFSLYSYDGSTFTNITESGLGDSDNAYDWSMAEANGRIFLGTFNQSLGIANLYYADEPSTWTQMDLPDGWGTLNYGIRDMLVANGMLYLGSASNIVAPDVLSYWSRETKPGTEVWEVPLPVVAPSIP